MNAADPKPRKTVARSRLPLLFGAMVALIAAVIALLSLLQKDREDWVRHTLLVETSLSELSNSVYRVEALERGYLITGADNFIRFYERERIAVPAQMAEVGALTAGNAAERAQIATLRAAVQRKLAELDGAVALRKAGQALERAYRELSTINTELVAEMSSRAAAENQVRQMQKMEAIGQLTGGIAHDFNNMLAVVIGNLNMIQRRLAKGEQDIGRFVDAALEGAQRATTLTGRLLAFSRQQPLAPEPIEPNRLVLAM